MELAVRDLTELDADVFALANDARVQASLAGAARSTRVSKASERPKENAVRTMLCTKPWATRGLR